MRHIARFNLAVALCLLAYEGLHAEELHPEYDITTTTIIVNWYDTAEELETALEDDRYAGMAACEYRPEFNVSFCELWLVRPTEVDTWTDMPEQDRWKTIGHEFYHTVAGEFHD